MELHGGSIWCESKDEGQGSVFTVEFPMVRKFGAADGAADGALSSSGKALQLVALFDGLLSAAASAATNEAVSGVSRASLSVSVAPGAPGGAALVSDAADRDTSHSDLQTTPVTTAAAAADADAAALGTETAARVPSAPQLVTAASAESGHSEGPKKADEGEVTTLSTPVAASPARRRSPPIQQASRKAAGGPTYHILVVRHPHPRPRPLTQKAPV